MAPWKYACHTFAQRAILAGHAPSSNQHCIETCAARCCWAGLCKAESASGTQRCGQKFGTQSCSRRFLVAGIDAVSYQFHHITQSTSMMWWHWQETWNCTTAGKMPPHPTQYENQKSLLIFIRFLVGHPAFCAFFCGLGPSSAATGACPCNPCRWCAFGHSTEGPGVAALGEEYASECGCLAYSLTASMCVIFCFLMLFVFFSCVLFFLRQKVRSALLKPKRCGRPFLWLVWLWARLRTTRSSIPLTLSEAWRRATAWNCFCRTRILQSAKKPCGNFGPGGGYSMGKTIPSSRRCGRRICVSHSRFVCMATKGEASCLNLGLGFCGLSGFGVPSFLFHWTLSGKKKSPMPYYDNIVTEYVGAWHLQNKWPSRSRKRLNFVGHPEVTRFLSFCALRET